MSENIPVAVAYYLNGANFRASAEKLMAGLEFDDTGRPATLMAIPLYFLASHAAELFLKAALLKRGTSMSELRGFEYRHNLSALMELLLRKGVSISSDSIAVITGLSAQHADHSLRYAVLVDDGKSTYWPPCASVFEALDELLLLTRVRGMEQ